MCYLFFVFCKKKGLVLRKKTKENHRNHQPNTLMIHKQHLNLAPSITVFIWANGTNWRKSVYLGIFQEKGTQTRYSR